MKILYITSIVSGAGGVERTLALKSDYFIENFNYEVAIIYNEITDKIPFYSFNTKVKLHNLKLDKKSFSYIFKFKNEIQKIINRNCPDIIIVSDNGLKGFLVPFLLKNNIPILLEVHGSRTEIINRKTSIVSVLKRKLHIKIKSYAINRFAQVVFLNEKSAAEWGFNKAKIISNSLSFESNEPSKLDSKIAIAVGRHSYEKGFDRLLPIWKEVSSQNPEWKLKIYGDFAEETTFLKREIEKLQLRDSVELLLPVKNIENVYKDASVFLMTSRFEGFGLALLEAMASGLPCMAYDCPIGPRVIITNAENGFLIPDDNIKMYIEKLSFLIENEEVRVKFGLDAKEISKEYSLEKIMEQWKAFLESLIGC